MKNAFKRFISRLKTAKEYISETGLQKFPKSNRKKVGEKTHQVELPRIEAISNDLTYLYLDFQNPREGIEQQRYMKKL